MERLMDGASGGSGYGSGSLYNATGSKDGKTYRDGTFYHHNDSRSYSGEGDFYEDDLDGRGRGGGGGGNINIGAIGNPLAGDSTLRYEIRGNEQPQNTSGTLRCRWDIPETLADIGQEVGSDNVKVVGDTIRRAVGNSVVILGNADTFVCTTCQQHLEATWKNEGAMALRMFAAAIHRIKFGGNPVLEAEETGPSFESGHKRYARVHFTMYRSDTERRRNLVYALRWLCAAVRRPPSPDQRASMVEESTAGFEKLVWTFIEGQRWTWDKNGPYELAMWRSRPVRPQLPKPSCWTELFAEGVVIESLLTREWGKGLETSFELMVTLAGIENAWPVDGGLILLGFFTALVPVARHEKTNSVQWHLEVLKDGVDPRRLESLGVDWFRTDNMDLLKQSRCFIGWFEKAHIMLGTSKLAADKATRLERTTLPARERTIHLSGHELTGQVGLSAGPFTGALQTTGTYRFHSNKQQYGAPEQFSNALYLHRKEVAFVIDAPTRRGWLVPMLSWILHLAHTCYFELCSNKDDTPIPFAEASTEGAEATISALKAAGGKVIFGDGTEDQMTLRQLWHRIFVNLWETHRDKEDPQHDVLFAAEAMDVALSRPSNLKEVRLSEESRHWAEFAKLAKTTTVCAKLGNAIRPVPPSGKLCECCTLLEERDFVAAHTWSLQQLLKQKGSSLSQLGDEGLLFSDGSLWTVGDGLERFWTKCPAGLECCNVWGKDPSSSPILQKRVQRHKDKGKGTAEEWETSIETAPESGVVVFGGRSAFKGAAVMSEPIVALHGRFSLFKLFPRQGMAGN